MNKFNSDFKVINENFFNLIENLNNDIEILYQYLKKDNKQVLKRAYIKAIFSSIESVIYNMKEFIKVLQRYAYIPLSKTQQKKLDEYYFQKTAKKKATRKKYHLSFLDNIAFTIELFAYSNYIFMTIDRNCSGWKCLESSVKIRNRITHPKHSSDIMVMDSDVDELNHAYNWFYNTIIHLHEDSLKFTLTQLNTAKRILSKTKKST